MRAVYKHAIGVLAVVLWILYFLQSGVRALLQPTDPWVLTREQLSESTGPVDESNAIPKIIHQVYLGWGGLPMPKHWEKTRQSCIDLNPEYEHIQWTNETSRDLLVNEYPWFVKTWDNYAHPIQRADSIRYFILASYGGIYIDLDNGCARNLDMLRKVPAWMPGTTNRLGLTNHIMGGVKGHGYFRMLVESLESYNYDWILPYLTIMNSAGPHFVSMVWSAYLEKEQADDVLILSLEGYEGQSWSFFNKVEGLTWNTWDTLAFAWMGHHVILVTCAFFAGMFSIVGAIWFVAWKIVLLAERSRHRGLDYSKLA